MEMENIKEKQSEMKDTISETKSMLEGISGLDEVRIKTVI